MVVLGLGLAVAVVSCVGVLAGDNADSPVVAPDATPAAQAVPPKTAADLLAEANDTSLSAADRKTLAEQVIQRYPATEEAGQAITLMDQMEAQIAKENIGKQWQYHRSEDGMSGKTSRSALVRSTNTFRFDFPYNGPQRATLQIRRHPRFGNDVIFEIEKGQILCHSFSSCPVRIRFDDESPRTYTGNEPADNSSTYVFVPGFSDLTQRIARAKRMRVEVNVYQQGTLQAEFDVEGFDMKRLTED